MMLFQWFAGLAIGLRLSHTLKKTDKLENDGVFDMKGIIPGALCFFLTAIILSSSLPVQGASRVEDISRVLRNKVDDSWATVAGEITAIRGSDGFLLQDSTGRIRVYAGKDKIKEKGLAVGQKVIVGGKLRKTLITGKELVAISILPQETVGVPRRIRPESAESDTSRLRTVGWVLVNAGNGSPVMIEGTLSKRKQNIFLRDKTGRIRIQASEENLSEIDFASNQTVVVRGVMEKSLWGKKAIRVESIETKGSRALSENLFLSPGTDREELSSSGAGESLTRRIRSVLQSAKDGDQVTISGKIVKKFGQDEFRLQDDSGSVIVHADSKDFADLDLSVGQGVTVTGRFSKALWGKKEVVAASIHSKPSEDRIAETPRTPAVKTEPSAAAKGEIRFIGWVLRNAEKGQEVAVMGKVVSVGRGEQEDEFTLKDDTGEMDIYAGRQRIAALDLRVGMAIVVAGEFVKGFPTGQWVDARTIRPVEERPTAEDLKVMDIYWIRTRAKDQIQVRVAGEIHSLEDDRIILSDQTGKMDILSTPEQLQGVSVGQRVRVSGRLDKSAWGKSVVHAEFIEIQ